MFFMFCLIFSFLQMASSYFLFLCVLFCSFNIACEISISVCEVCCNKGREAGVLNNRNVFLHFWRLEVRDQGGWKPKSVSSEASLLPASSRGLRSVCVCALITFSHKDTSHSGLGSMLMTLLQLNHLFKDHISKYSHTLIYWG